jgi:hypothetical protein
MSKDFFEVGIADSFQPLAIRTGLPLRKLHDGVYELVCKEFVMRIRRGTGHGKDFLVTLSRKKVVSGDPLDLTGEVGLAVLAEYNGATADALALRARDPHRVHSEELLKQQNTFVCPIFWEGE